MKTPTIPPNCDFFVKTFAPNTWGFELEPDDEGHCDWWPMTDEDWAKLHPAQQLYWRPIITAVARCAWLDEAERLAKLDAYLHGERIDIALGSADAWRVWGEKLEAK